MSEESLVSWLERFMFGSKEVFSIPTEIHLLVSRLEGVDVKEIMQNGGLANLVQSLSQDLQKVVSYVKEGGDDPRLETPMISSFFNSLSHATGKRLSKVTAEEPTTTSDWEILELIIKNLDTGRTFEYTDAKFWGDLARRLLHLQRPFNLTEIDTVPMFIDVIRLYDHTCKSLGRLVDPFSMVMVPREDHVDSVHWSTPDAFRQFLKSDHTLAKTVKSVVMNSILEARYEDLPEDWRLSGFLKNVRRVHETVRSVEGTDVPPVLIDVFQRLLTEVGKDSVWEIDTAVVPESPVTEHLSLYLRMLEMERFISASSNCRD